MSRIGEPKREIYVEPMELPEPLREATPTVEPAQVPAAVPDRVETHEPTRAR